jgi:hypothetical protein
MGDIYTGSTLNIAATASLDGNGGLYFDRDPLLVQPLQLVIHWPFQDDVAGSLLVTTLPTNFYCISKNTWGKNVDKAPLNVRAWVMQERTLSPRMVQFAQMQLFWECKQMQACESYPNGLDIPRHDWVEDRVMATLDQLNRLKIESPGSTAVEKLISEAHRGWISTAVLYSACSLTREADILIAISGVAKVYVRSLDDVYLAGLMKSSLEFGLLWFTTRSAKGSSPNRVPWRAPSWAWPSIKAGVSWDEEHFPVLFQQSTVRHFPQFKLLEDPYIQSVGEDQTGPLSDAWMKVEASTILLHLIPGQSVCTCNGSTSILGGHGSLDPNSIEILGWHKVQVWMDINGERHSVEARFDETKDMCRPFNGHYDGSRGSKLYVPVIDQDFDTPILAMPILVTMGAPDIQNNIPSFYSLQGLLLKRPSTSPGGTEGMARIGCFTMHLVNDNHKKAIDYLLKCWHPKRQEITLV